MLTASQFLLHFGGRLLNGIPAPAGKLLLRVSERPARPCNWLVEIDTPAPLRVAERWSAVFTDSWINCPVIDFVDAVEEHLGARSLSRNLGIGVTTPAPEPRRRPFLLRWSR